MHMQVELLKYREGDSGTELQISVPDKHLSDYLIKNRINKGELRVDDGRMITTDQRKKIYATIKDISDFTGYHPEEQKQWLKYLHIQRTGCDEFSLSDCSITTAREFINTIIDYALENGIILAESALYRTDDINTYLIACMKYRRCCICGKQADIHHCEGSRVGMGGDRNAVSNVGRDLIALCRNHHTILHNMPESDFFEKYKVYGIFMTEYLLKLINYK